MDINLDKFDWGWMDGINDTTHIHLDGRHEDIGQYHKNTIINEIFIQKVYERFFEVEDGDIVLDIGASIGPFTYSILDKNPKSVLCVEPSPNEHDTLIKNVSRENVKIVKKGISKNDDDIIDTYVFGNIKENLYGINFNTLLNQNNIDTIDFLKIDCEGGEYDVFTIENLCWLKENLKKCSGEWHLSNDEQKQKFREFRDIFLRVFPKHEIYSIDGVNIKWDLWNEHFIEYYSEVIIYIDNR